MSQFLHDNNTAANAKALAWVFSANSRAKKSYIQTDEQANKLTPAYPLTHYQTTIFRLFQTE